MNQKRIELYACPSCEKLATHPGNCTVHQAPRTKLTAIVVKEERVA